VREPFDQGVRSRSSPSVHVHQQRLPLPRISSERAARAHALFRQVNDELVRTAVGEVGAVRLVVCECSREDCIEALEITVREYEAIRRDPARFVVAAAHAHEETDVVLERHRRFAVVGTRGTARQVAAATNPRQR